MKKKESFALTVQFFLLTIVPLSLSSQSIQFSYDNCGNRTNRESNYFFKNSHDKPDISHQSETKIFELSLYESMILSNRGESFWP